MVSLYYVRHMQPEERPPLPLMIDSGGFASLFARARVVRTHGLGVLQLPKGDAVETLHPREVLELQERLADIALSLDFPIPPNTAHREGRRRQQLTIANAHWALANRRRRDLPLYAVVQAWDAESARECARAYATASFDGIAIGGLVPRARDLQMVCAIVEAVRQEIGERPLHVLGLGKPEMVEQLFHLGVDSVDSSAYVQLAADGRLWSHPTYRGADLSLTDRLHLALCNLATATGRALPLSAAKIVFLTHTVASQTDAHVPALS
jgi:helicase